MLFELIFILPLVILLKVEKSYIQLKGYIENIEFQLNIFQKLDVGFYIPVALAMGRLSSSD